MLRHLFTLLSALALLFSVAFAVLWVRSRDVHEQVFGARRGGRLWWVESNRGRVEVVVVQGWPLAEPVRHVREPHRSPGGRQYIADATEERLGVRVVRGRAGVEVLTRGPPFIGEDEVADVRERIRSFGQRSTFVPLPGTWDGERRWWWVTTEAGGGFAVFAPPRPMWAVQFPHGLAAAVFAVLPVGWLVTFARRALVRRRRLRRGLCGGCGYDLTGNASGVCPECGDGLSVVAAPSGLAEVPSSE